MLQQAGCSWLLYDASCCCCEVLPAAPAAALACFWCKQWVLMHALALGPKRSSISGIAGQHRWLTAPALQTPALQTPALQTPPLQLLQPMTVLG